MRLVMIQEKFDELKAADLTTIRHKVADLKILVVDIFQYLCDSGLFTLKFHLLNFLTNGLRRFKHMRMLDVSSFER